MRFYRGSSEFRVPSSESPLSPAGRGRNQSAIANLKSDILIDPLKHSPALGAAIAFQGVHHALPVIHGAQGCTFLGKVLLTKHFREPIALATTKLFVENVVMGGEENLVQAVEGFIQKNEPDIVGILTSGLCEVKGDDVAAAVGSLQSKVESQGGKTKIVHVSTPDYAGGLETGYARAVEALTSLAERPRAGHDASGLDGAKILNVFIGPHLTPADVLEIRELVESFGLRPVILPALSALDGSRQGLSSLSSGGTTVRELRSMGGAGYTIAIGTSMEPAAKLMQRRFGIEYGLFESIAGLRGADRFLDALSRISGRPVPEKYQRQRLVLIDGMRDAHFFFGGKNICLALEPDHAVQTSRWIEEMGAAVGLAVVPTLSEAVDAIRAQNVEIGGLSSIRGKFDLLISNSHATDTAKRLMVPLYQTGFPVYKVLGHTAKVTVGYRGTLAMVNEVGNLMMAAH
jgi:nitrogenase molybdenum-iron cofactor biosynthesis protein NifN